MTVTLDAIREAATAIDGEILRTPLLRVPGLAERSGADLRLKLENLQTTGSFKARGALTRLLRLDAAERRRGVIAVSAGNHAQAVAYFARRLGVPATIVMPSTAPFTKVEHTERFGAQVLQRGESLQECMALMEETARRERLTVVHPFDDPLVIAGQGTIALEMLADAPELEILVVPVGGGGLISGIATAAKAIKPGIEIVGVQAARYAAMRDALGQGGGTAIGGITLADGIAVKTPGQLTREIVRRLVDRLAVVDELALEQAVHLFAEDAHLVVEGAGAAALAAILTAPERFRGRVVGAVVSGGNIDARLLASVLLRGLARSGRMFRLRADIADTPGTLAAISRLIGEAGGNIVEIIHQRMFYDVPVRQAELDIVIETRDAAHGEEIVKLLVDAGFATRRLSDSGIPGSAG